MPPMPSSLRTDFTAPKLDGWMIASSLVIFSASFALAKWMTANAPAPSLFIEEALLGATLLWTRRCVPPRLRTLKDHSADLRFDMEAKRMLTTTQNFTVSLCSLRAIRKKGKLKNQIAWIEMRYSHFVIRDMKRAAGVIKRRRPRPSCRISLLAIGPKKIQNPDPSKNGKDRALEKPHYFLIIYIFLYYYIGNFCHSRDAGRRYHPPLGMSRFSRRANTNS